MGRIYNFQTNFEKNKQEIDTKIGTNFENVVQKHTKSNFVSLKNL